MDADPCSKVVRSETVSLGYSFEQRARTGVSSCIDAGGPANNPASQYNQVGGGSTSNPEEADTYSSGVIRLSLFLDCRFHWYDIEVTDAISSVNPEPPLFMP